MSLFEPNVEGSLPLVIVSPGFQLDRDFYRSYAEHLASWGFIVATQSYSGRVSGNCSSHASIAEDTLALVEVLTNDTFLNLDINPEAVGLVGHSLGGKISILSAVLDSSIAAVVGLDPVDANTPSVTPGLSVISRAALADWGNT